MKKSILAFGLFLALSTAAAGAFAGSYDTLGPTEKQKMMEEHYTLALQAFNNEDYSQAVSHWEEILKIDPEQSSPPQLIRQARAKLAEQIGPLEGELKDIVGSGNYSEALGKIKQIQEKDPNSASARALLKKLESVSALYPQETRRGHVPALVRRAIYTHLFNDDNAKFAVNAARYARDLNPKYPAINDLAAYMEGQYPDIAQKETITPGMSVVDHKLFIALNHIYEGRYDLAIFDCNEVLELDSANVLALKRKGSAYFALKQKDKARLIWQQALKISPDDPEIKKFLQAQ